MNNILRALKAFGVTLGIPALVILLGIVGVLGITFVFGWLGTLLLRQFFPFGGC
jgi:hypothetical protein